jgi:hypothetical protein
MTHVFSLRIFTCNLLNLIFWIFVFAGCRIGIQRGINAHSWTIGFVSGFVGLLLGTIVGIVFLWIFYLLHQRRMSRESQNHEKTDA